MSFSQLSRRFCEVMMPTTGEKGNQGTCPNDQHILRSSGRLLLHSELLAE